MFTNTLIAITLVGMKYNSVTPKEVEDYDHLFFVAEPDNPVDSKAIRVLGWTLGSDAPGKMLGHVSVSSQPGSHFPANGTDGTVYKVYSSHANNASVEILLYEAPFIIN